MFSKKIPIAKNAVLVCDNGSVKYRRIGRLDDNIVIAYLTYIDFIV